MTKSKARRKVKKLWGKRGRVSTSVDNYKGTPIVRFKIGWRKRNRKVWWAGDSWEECFDTLNRFSDYNKVF